MTITITCFGGRLLVRSPYDPAIIEVLREIPGRHWCSTSRVWSLPAEELVAGLLVAAFQDAQLDEGTTALVAAYRAREAARTTREAGTAEEPPDYPWPEGMPPYGHQRAVAGILEGAREYALLWEMGTGKTYSAAVDIRRRLDCGDVVASLVVCPVSLLDMWRQSLLRIAGIDAAIVAGAAPKRTKLRAASLHCIVGYESLRVDRAAWEIWARSHGGRLTMICDESTRIKSPRAAQTKAATAVGRWATWRRIMTGTPVTQSPLDAFAQFGFLSPAILGHGSFVSFRSRYAIMGGYEQHQVVAWRYLEELSDRVRSYSSRVLKADCLDLPAKVYTSRRVRLGDEARADYRRLVDEFLLEVAGQEILAANVLTRLLRLSMIAGGYLSQDGQVVRQYASQPKLDELERVLDENGDRKVIVWCRFLHEIRMVERVLAARGYSPVTFSGDTPAGDRQAIVDRFQDDLGCRVFIGQVHTGGVGLTLTAASLVIYYSHSYSLEDRLQSEDRAHRIGQSRSVLYVDLVAEGTVDVAIMRALATKRNLADLITRDSLRALVTGGEQ